MNTWKAAAAAAALSATLLVIPTSADAQSLTVTDPQGDTGTPGLDITSARIGNRDQAIVTTLTFSTDRPGKVIVAIGTRDHRFAAIPVTRHRAQGPDDTFLVNPGGVPAGRPCPGLTSEWKRASATLQLRLPSGCVLGGNYGAIRVWVLTERLHSGGDVDQAPQTPQGGIAFTGWIPRG